MRTGLFVTVGMLAATAAVPGVVAGAAIQPLAAPPGELVLPDGLVVGVEFPRYLAVQRRLEAIIDNQSAVPVTVIDIALHSPLFEPVAADEHDYIVAAHLRQDLQMGIGESICPTAAGPSMVEMTVEIDGERQHGLVEIDATAIARINDTECNQQFVIDHVDIGFGPEFEVADGVMTTAVNLARRSGDDVITLTATRGSVLIVVLPVETAEPLATMASDQSVVAAAVTMHVGRCEAHAVADAKKPFQFAVWVTVGDSPEYFVTVTPEGELRAALEALIQECIAADTTE